MKKMLLIVVGGLIVIGGLFFIFNQNQNKSGDPDSAETSSSQNIDTSKDEAQSNGQNEAAASASHSSESTLSESSSGGSSADASGEAAESDSSTSAGSNASTADGSKGSSGTTGEEANRSQAVDRPDGAWVDTFEKNLYDGYRATPSRYKYIGDGLWEVWVNEHPTGEQPYVTVNQHTGDFHG